MRRVSGGAACLALFALTTSACLGPRAAGPDPVHERRIDRAFENALSAQDPWERELWRQEYERRARAYETRLESARKRQEARAEFWRQLGLTAQEIGSIYLQSRQPSD